MISKQAGSLLRNSSNRSMSFLPLSGVRLSSRQFQNSIHALAKQPIDSLICSSIRFERAAERVRYPSFRAFDSRERSQYMSTGVGPGKNAQHSRTMHRFHDQDQVRALGE